MFGNADPSAAGTATAGPAPREAGAAAPGECCAVTQMAENTAQPVDIAFGVDATGSEAEEIAFTEQNMRAFSQQIVSAGIDARVALLSTAKDGMPAVPVHVDGVCIGAPLGSGQCPADSKPPDYVHVVHPMTDWDMLQSHADA